MSISVSIPLIRQVAFVHLQNAHLDFVYILSLAEKYS